MGRNNKDFENGHNWARGEDDTFGPGEISSTPVGNYIVTKGAGKLKWAVNHPTSGWEVLGTTRNEVRAEADNHLADELKKKSESNE